MLSKLYFHLDFNKNEARNMVVANLAAAPGTPLAGQVYWDTALTRLRVWDGATWGLKATDSDALSGQGAAFYLSRANHTGTQTAATISDFATTAQGYRLDQFAVPTAPLNFNGQRGINVADPTGPQDIATMAFVQSQVNNAAAGIDAKASVRVVLTTNDTLSGLAARDSVAIVAGDRVLAAAQTTGAQNGVYVAAAGAWTRAADADANGEITPGASWYVEEGSAPNLKTTWRVENTGTIVVGVTSIVINKMFGAINYTASLGVQLVGNDIRAQVVAAGGVEAVAGGLQIDKTRVARGFSSIFGTGASPTAVINHNLNTTKVSVTIKEIATNELVGAKVVITDANNVTITFSANILNAGFTATVFVVE